MPQHDRNAKRRKPVFCDLIPVVTRNLRVWRGRFHQRRSSFNHRSRFRFLEKERRWSVTYSITVIIYYLSKGRVTRAFSRRDSLNIGLLPDSTRTSCVKKKTIYPSVFREKKKYRLSKEIKLVGSSNLISTSEKLTPGWTGGCERAAEERTGKIYYWRVNTSIYSTYFWDALPL